MTAFGPNGPKTDMLRSENASQQPRLDLMTLENQQHMRNTIVKCIEERNILVDDMQKKPAERDKEVVCAGKQTAMYVAVEFSSHMRVLWVPLACVSLTQCLFSSAKHGARGGVETYGVALVDPD